MKLGLMLPVKPDIQWALAAQLGVEVLPAPDPLTDRWF